MTRALSAGKKADSHAEETDRYRTLEGALACLIDECRVQGLTAQHDEGDLFDVPDGSNYPVDYRIQGRDGTPVFLYGVPNRDKARLTTITLPHFLLHHLAFESVIVFADQQEIPRLDLARLANVAGTAVASLDAEEDLRRKIGRLAA